VVSVRHVVLRDIESQFVTSSMQALTRFPTSRRQEFGGVSHERRHGSKSSMHGRGERIAEFFREDRKALVEMLIASPDIVEEVGSCSLRGGKVNNRETGVVQVEKSLLATVGGDLLDVFLVYCFARCHHKIHQVV